MTFAHNSVTTKATNLKDSHYLDSVRNRQTPPVVEPNVPTLEEQRRRRQVDDEKLKKNSILPEVYHPLKTISLVHQLWITLDFL